MFCAKCGIENLIEQKYCRQCGHHLVGHRVALEGNFEVAATNLRKGEDSVGTGLVILGICALNILANWLLGGDAIGILINLAIGLMVAVPFMIIGLMRLERANKVFNVTEQPGKKAIEESKATAIEMPAAPITDRSLSTAEAPASVTEHTTLDLKTPVPSRKRRSNKV
jgi:hypothetical protein